MILSISPRFMEFEGNPFFQMKHSEWGFNIYQKGGRHFLKLKGMTDKGYDIEGYRDKLEQIDYFKNKSRILPSYATIDYYKVV
jgi:hypothetical protein